MATATPPEPIVVELLPLLLTIVRSAEVLDVSESTVHRMVKRGQLPTVRVGRSVRIPRHAVLELCGEKV